MKKTISSPIATTTVAAADDAALRAASGAGLDPFDMIDKAYDAIGEVLEGIRDGYAKYDTDQDIRYGGSDGLPPPNA